MGTWSYNKRRVLTNIYFKCLFFIYCSSLCGLHLFTGGEGQTEGLGGQVQFHFLAMGGCGSGGFKTNLNKKYGGSRQIFFFSITSARITFFSNVRVRQEGGIIQANLKNSGRVGTWGF